MFGNVSKVELTCIVYVSRGTLRYVTILTHADDAIREDDKVDVDTTDTHPFQTFLSRVVLDNFQLSLFPARLV